MLIVTTPFIEGKKILEFKGPIFAQVTRGVGAIRGFGAGVKSVTGGRSTGHEKSVIEVRGKALEEMTEEARNLGANAIIGLTLDYEMLSNNAFPFESMTEASCLCFAMSIPQ